MRVPWTIVRSELRNFGRERLPWVAIAIFALLSAYATAAGWAFTRSETQTQRALLTADEDRRRKLSEEVRAIAAGAPVRHAADPRDPLTVGEKLAPRAVVLPPGPLSLVAVGQRDLLPQALLLTTELRAAEGARDDGSSPGRRASGPFDLAYVVVLLLPLLVIVLSYDLLAGERERGTLSLVLSQPISLSSFVFGKALARAGVVVTVVLVLALAGPVLSGGWLAPGGGIRLLGYAAVLVAYTLLWFVLAVAVDAWGRSAAANALALVGLWLGLTVVTPGLANAAVETLYPSPSRVELVNVARAAARSAEAQASDLAGDHGKPATGGVARGRRAVEIQEALARQLEPVLARFDEQRGRRQALVEQLRFASPAIIVAECLSDLAGSSATRSRAFASQIATFQLDLRRFFFDRAARAQPLEPTDHNRIPGFTFRESPDGELIMRLLSSLLGLAVPTALAFAAALAGLRRQAVRGLR